MFFVDKKYFVEEWIPGFKYNMETITPKKTSIDEYLSENKENFERTLFDLLKIPSISAQEPHLPDCRWAAEWLAAYFRRMNFRAELLETAENPLVFAESPRIPNAPTVLIYGHYDVQPPDPEAKWLTPPFEPTIRDGVLYARGATDDKGPLMAHVFAVEYWARTGQPLKLNWKFLIEGNEECGGDAAGEYVRNHRGALKCDYLVLSDSPQLAPGQPAITRGLRGIAAYELKLTGPNRDLHSGMFGGAVTNPCDALARMLAALKDENQRVAIPGFYDDVRPISSNERHQLGTLPQAETEFYAGVGVTDGIGEEGFSPLERRWVRPCLDINGISGGYQGEGGKTIIPASASAKFSCRLVPNQDPEKITVSLRKFLEKLCPPGIRMSLDARGGSRGVTIDTSTPCMQAAVRAIEFGFGRSPVFIYEGGSIPIVTTFVECLTPNIMMIGLSQSTDNAHSPNEHFSLADFYHGIKTSARLWRELAGL